MVSISSHTYSHLVPPLIGSPFCPLFHTQTRFWPLENFGKEVKKKRGRKCPREFRAADITWNFLSSFFPYLEPLVSNLIVVIHLVVYCLFISKGVSVGSFGSVTRIGTCLLILAYTRLGLFGCGILKAVRGLIDPSGERGSSRKVLITCHCNQFEHTYVYKPISIFVFLAIIYPQKSLKGRD